MNNVCVVHLIWAPMGIEPFARFLSSYQRHPAGRRHRLLLVFNGFGDRSEIAPYLALADDLPHETLFLERRVWDLEAYALAARHTTDDVLCVLNSHSAILADGWLAKLCDVLARPGVGIVGACGNAESLYSNLVLGLRFPTRRSLPRRLLRFGRRFLTLVSARRSFPPHPNVHLRTNGFALRRETLLGLRFPRLRTKWDCHRFESGRSGLSAQIRAGGADLLVVGRDGKGYAPHEWRRSATYRCGEQRNLLIEDNQTRDYATATPERRRLLHEYSWGTAEI